jgi:hypothetical protein
MLASEPAKGTVARQLRQAVERLHSEIEHVEFWATVLDQMTQPIPSYDSTTKQLNAFNLARQGATPDGTAHGVHHGAAHANSHSTADDIRPARAAPAPNRR